MTTIKITIGCVVQEFVGSKCVHQEFVAADNVNHIATMNKLVAYNKLQFPLKTIEYTCTNGEVIENPGEFIRSLKHPFFMRQP